MGTVLARNGHSVCILIRDPVVCESINKQHRNPRYLSEYTLPENLTACTDAKQSLDNVDWIVHAIPVQESPAYLRALASLIPLHAPIVSLSKGIHSESLRFMYDIINDALGHDHPSCFLSGPSFARELMDKQPTGLVIGCSDEKLSHRIGCCFQSDRLRVYTTTDVIGVEIGGALKNIYAIAAGAAEGLGFRLNTAAFLVTRGCAEMKKIALAKGAREQTLAGLSGIGDLMLTCFGGASRNRTVGSRIGKGEKLDDILKTMGEVAEGVPTALAAVRLADSLKLDVPIARAICDVLHNGADIRQRVTALLSLPLRPEDS